MLQRNFGNTGLVVSALGFGAGNIGDPAMPESEVSTLLNTALDSGITLLDTARSYGLSEERIGRHLRHRRNEIVISTKVGYGIPGIPDWTGAVIAAGVENALRLLQTDRIDIVHLHSCPLNILQQTDVVDALNKTVSAGKVRVCAYSGENEPSQWAVRSGMFGSIQTSVNICDQRSLQTTVAAAEQKGIGVIAKRPLANAVWRMQHPPSNDDAAAEYWKRWRILNPNTAGLDPSELALRFVLSLPAVHACVVGTRSVENLARNVAFVEKGPLPEELLTSIRNAFQEHGTLWPGMI